MDDTKTDKLISSRPVTITVRGQEPWPDDGQVKILMRQEGSAGKYLSRFGWGDRLYWLTLERTDRDGNELRLFIPETIASHIAPEERIRLGVSFDGKLIYARQFVTWPNYNDDAIWAPAPQGAQTSDLKIEADSQSQMEPALNRPRTLRFAPAVAVILIVAVGAAVAAWYGKDILENAGKGGRDSVEEILQRGAKADQVLANAKEFEKNGKMKEAFILYRFAARRGEPDAMRRIAEMYNPLLVGKVKSPLVQDVGEAIAWYRKAAALGDKRAQQELEELAATTRGRTK